jgi:hypothetical protein
MAALIAPFAVKTTLTAKTAKRAAKGAKTFGFQNSF